VQKFAFNMTDNGTTMHPTSVGGFYLCSEADVRIAELKRVLKIARDRIANVNRGSTHWEGCESCHPDCAMVAGIDKTLSE